MKRLRPTLLLGLLTLLGCPHSHASMEPDEALALLADAYCDRVAREPVALWPAREIDRVSRDVCVTDATRRMSEFFVRFPEGGVERCVEAFHDAPATEFSAFVDDGPEFAGCESLYGRDVRSEGEACRWSRECAPNQRCLRGPSTCEGPTRVCVALEGECARDSDCPSRDGEPMRCSLGSRCVSFVTNPPAGLGGACGSSIEDDREVFTPCEDGLVCVWWEPFDGTCQTPAREGEACGSGTRCEAGTWCDHVSEVCLRIRLGAEGDRCFPGSCDPREGLMCDRTDGVCRRPAGGWGSECSNRHPTIGCRDGFWCDRGGCRPRGTLGERCEHGLECESGACVDHVCVAHCE